MPSFDRRALFGISLDSGLFTTERFIRAIERLRRYDRITFFVADGLQVYNDLAKLAEDSDRLSAEDWSALRGRSLQERRKWLSRVRGHLTNWSAKQQWTVIGVGELTDGRAWEIARRVRLLFLLDATFQTDVRQQASMFSAGRQFGSAGGSLVNVSIEYLLEEAALNIRMRVVDHIEDEFYLGRFPHFFRKLYAGKYIKSATELAGENDCKMPFRLFDWVNDKEWAEPDDVGLQQFDEVVVPLRRRQ